jgi:UPF0755 protein
VKVWRVVLGLGLVAVAAGAYVALWPYGPAQETFVDIAPGTSSVGIAQQLEAAGVIRSAVAFELLKAWKDRNGGQAARPGDVHGRSSAVQKAATLKAGEYRFTRAVPMSEVYDRLVAGDVFTIAVSVPEGYNIFDVATAVSAAGLGSREDFLAAALQHPELVAQWSPGARSVEGFLYPDTYRFSRHATPQQIIAAMVKRFGQEAAKLGLVADPRSQNRDLGHPESRTVKDIVTMASLVEREVHLDGERALVAGVFENRLRAGMPLQTDPSVAYASMLRGTWTGVIHVSELMSDSPYNTYKVKGLPPGPVCSPGEASLRAAMRPAATKFLYFVADANGATRFSQTLEEHNENVAEYRQRKY